MKRPTKLAKTGGFLLVAVWCVWLGFFKREVFYPFSKKQMEIRKEQIVSAFIALRFLFFT